MIVILYGLLWISYFLAILKTELMMTEQNITIKHDLNWKKNLHDVIIVVVIIHIYTVHIPYPSLWNFSSVERCAFGFLCARGKDTGYNYHLII